MDVCADMKYSWREGRIKLISVTFWKLKHISERMDGGLGWEVGGPVISYRRQWIGLLCPVNSVKKTCEWMVYVFNVAGIGSITVNQGNTTKAIRHNQRPHLCMCGTVCVCARASMWPACTANALIKYL